MALLNYAKTLEEVKGYLDATESSTGDYVKLIFTLDGHIITHGADLLADYLAGKRGMVPNYNSDLGNYAVLGKTGWEKLTTNHLPVASAITTPNADTIFTSQQIAEYVAKEIGAGFAANDAMVFKGGITKLSDIELPYSAGYTYRATESFTFTTDKKSWVVAPGDIVIATADSNTLDNNHFIVVEANINGVSEVSVNGKTYKVYTETVQDSYQFYAPTGPGVTGQILRSTNGVPEWANQSELNAGQLGGRTLGELLDNVTASDGVITVTVGGVLKTATATGTWNITAAKVANALGLGEGLLFADEKTSYDGSEVGTINLLPATTTTLGGVKIGDTITVNSGTISITKKNVIDALGYTPGDALASLVPATVDNIGGIKVGSVSTSASNAITTQGLNNYAVHIDSNNLGYVSLPNFVTSSGVTSITITLGIGITVSDSGTAITSTGSRIISLNTATTDIIGGIKIAKDNNYTVETNTSNISANVIAGKYYGVELDSTGKAFVYVPWTEYTAMTADEANEGIKTIARSITAKVLHDKISSMLPSVVSSTAAGLAPMIVKETGAITNDFYVLASSNGSDAPSWYKLPAKAFSDTWRDIKIAGNSIGTKSLNFMPTGDIYVKIDDQNPNNEDTFDVSFGLSWWNISANNGQGAYEYAN